MLDPQTVTAAEYALDNGWLPGTILWGEPTMRDGEVMERGRHFKVTAIGESSVVGRTFFEEGMWSSEHFITFRVRQWSKAEDVERLP